jgi:hypothetical protein
MIIRFVPELFETRYPIMIGELVDQQDDFFKNPILPRRMATGGLSRNIVSGFRSSGSVPYAGPDDCYCLRIEERRREGSPSEPGAARGNGMGPGGKKRERL